MKDNKKKNPSGPSDLIGMINLSAVGKKTTGAKTGHGAKKPEKPAAAGKEFEPVIKTSFEISRTRYEQLKTVASRNGLSMRKLTETILSSFVEDYVRKHGPITPRESKISLDELV